MDTDTGLGKESAGRGFARRAWKPLTASVVVGLVVAGLGYYSLSGERDGRRMGRELRAELPGPVEQKLMKDLSAAIAASLDKAIECGKWGPWEQFVNRAMEAINMMKSGTWTADQAMAHISKYSKYFFAFILTFLTSSSLVGDAPAAQGAEIGYKPWYCEIEVPKITDCKATLSDFEYLVGRYWDLDWKKKNLKKGEQFCKTEAQLRAMKYAIERSMKRLREVTGSLAKGLLRNCRAIIGDPYDGLRLELGTPTLEEEKRMQGILEKYRERSQAVAESHWKKTCGSCKAADTSENGAPIVGGFEGFEGLAGEGTPSDEDTSEGGTSEEGTCPGLCDLGVSCTIDLSKVNQPSSRVRVYDYNYDGDDLAAEAAAKAEAEKESCGSPSVCSTSLDEYCYESTDPVTGEPIDRGGEGVWLCTSPPNNCWEETQPDGSKIVKVGTPANCGCIPNDVDYCLAALDLPPGPAGYDGPTAPPGGGGAPTGPAGYNPPATAPGAIPGGGGAMPPSGAGGME